MEKMKLTRLKKRMIPICILLSAVAVTLFIWASYINKVPVKGKVVLEDFFVEISAEQSEEDGTVTLTPDEYEAFTLTVNKTGAGWSYIRVLIEESWMEKNSAAGTWTVIATTDGKLGLSQDVTAEDDYIYVKGIVKEPSISGDGIAILTGNNTLPGDLDSSKKYQVKLSIKVEAIQYNRLQALWGMDDSLFPQ